MCMALRLANVIFFITYSSSQLIRDRKQKTKQSEENVCIYKHCRFETLFIFCEKEVAHKLY